MTDAELWGRWQVWMGVAAVLVLAAAGLLITILITARRILAEAERTLAAAESIRAHTQPIWALQQSNEVAVRILETVGRIRTKSGGLAEAVQGSAVGGRHAQ